MIQTVTRLTKLTGEVIEPGVVLSHCDQPLTLLLDAPDSKWPRIVKLSGAGLTFERGDRVVAVAMADLLKLVETADPKMSPIRCP